MEEIGVPGSGPSPCIAAALRRASRRLTHLYDEALKVVGIRSTQLTILNAVIRLSLDPPTVAKLAQDVGMDRSTLGHNLRPLLRDGLVVVQATKEDRRRARVVLTPRGAEVFEEAKPIWQAAHEHFRKLYGDSETALLRDMLLQIAGDKRLTLEELERKN